MKNPTACCGSQKKLLQLFQPSSVLFFLALFALVSLTWNSASAQLKSCNADSECGDGNACTIDECLIPDVPPLPLTKAGFCINQPRGSCDDGIACTFDYPCNIYTGCNNQSTGCACPGSSCDDDNDCTVDWCETRGEVYVTPDPGGGSGTINSFQIGTCKHDVIICNDNNVCTVDGACDIYLEQCPAPVFVNCSDGNDCTTDFCDGVSGCIHGSACFDLNACTQDICTDEGCVFIPIVCDDGSVCTSDHCDINTGCVYAACDDNDVCTNDICEDGICRHEDRCPDNSLCFSVNLCNPSTGQCSPNGLKICAVDNLCTDEACNPATGECEVTSECNSPECCDDGTLCTEDICFNGICLHPVIICTADQDQCTQDFCQEGACVHPSICDDGNPCTIDQCDGSLNCTYTAKTCDDNNACTSDACVADSVDGCVFTVIPDCCASLNCSDGDTCTVDFCEPLLGCRNVPRTCNDANACTDDACNAEGKCIYTLNFCNDNTACTEDICADSTCINTTINCNDANACTQDGCHPVTGCFNNAYCPDNDPCTKDTCIWICDPYCSLCGPLGEPFCTLCDNCLNGPPTQCFSLPKCNDGNACTQDLCDAGVCTYLPVVCDDGDACTTDDCDVTTGCSYIPVSCDDFSNCTNDACVNGSCAYIAPGTACGTATPIACGSSMTGNNFCGSFNPNNVCGGILINGVFYSLTGVCGQITITVCNVDEQFINPLISVYTGDCDSLTCVNSGSDSAPGCTPNSAQITFNASAGTQYTIAVSSVEASYHIGNFTISVSCNEPNCNDGNVCTNDICENGACSHTNVNCDDANVCTFDYCIPNGNHGCHTIPVDCNDLNPCTSEHCEHPAGCVYTQTCDDGNPCTIDACNTACELPCSICEIQGFDEYCQQCTTCLLTMCTNTPVNCDDGNLCTSDICDAGSCTHPPVNCDDANPCTDDVCDGNGVCQYSAAICEDANACTTNDCNPAIGCVFTPKNCEDADDCTNDYCQSGVCRHDPVFNCCHDVIDCDDGNPCTQDECFAGVCSNLTDCSAIGAGCCDDNSACTQDICDFATGNCVNRADCLQDESCCNDAAACTQDICQSHGTYGTCVNIDTCTLNACTVSSCTPTIPPVCTFVRIDCSSGNKCIVATCDPITGCAGAPVDCNDYNACTDDNCDQAIGCMNTPKNCNDNNACTDDACDPATGCTNPVKDCDDGDPCTEDGCEPNAGCKYSNVSCDDGDLCTEDACDPGTTTVGNYRFTEEDPATGCEPNVQFTLDVTATIVSGDLFADITTHLTTRDTVADGPFSCGFWILNDSLGNEIERLSGSVYGDGWDIAYVLPAGSYTLCRSDCCKDPEGGFIYETYCVDFSVTGGCKHTPLDCDDGVDCTVDGCNNGVCSYDSSNCPVDCVVSGWSEWGSCSASCGGGTQCRTRTVITRDGNGGAACPALEECRPCNQQSCDPCFGAPAYSVRGLTLMYEHTVGEVGPLTHGQVIDKDTLCRFNIRADVCPTVIGSVKFQLSGTQTMTKVETVAPYAAFGDSPPGDYNPWSPPVGSYTLKVTGYSGPNASGTAGAPLIIQFSVVDATPGSATNCARPQVNCTALNCNDNNGCTTDECHPQTGCINTPVNCNDGNACTTEQCVSGACAYTSVVCNDGNACTTDACNPSTGCTYAAKNCNDFNACTTDGCNSTTGNCVNNPITCNDNNSCTTDACNPSTGCTYTQSGNCCTLNTQCDDGNFCTVDVCSSGTCVNTLVAQRVVTSFTLVNANSNTDIGPIDNGSVINLAVTPSVNIRANLCTNTGTESIRFKLNSTGNFRTESDIPYALAGDAPPGDYHKWNVTPGMYTITATPYSGNNATGTAGTPKTITITVVNAPAKMSAEDELPATQEETLLTAYPNPFTDRLNIEFTLAHDSKATLEVYSISGQRLATLLDANITAGEQQRIEYHPGNISGGMVIYRLQTEQQILYGKAVLVR